MTLRGARVTGMKGCGGEQEAKDDVAAGIHALDMIIRLSLAGEYAQNRETRPDATAVLVMRSLGMWNGGDGLAV